MTRRFLPMFAVLALLLTTAALVAQDKAVTLDGYLVDNACAAKGGDMSWVKTHGTSCATMDNCEKSGYAVYAKDKLYKFDEAGNTSAAEVIKNTKSKKGLHVKVEGTIDGDMIKVTKITEVKG